jgi:hypothetical protein
MDDCAVAVARSLATIKLMNIGIADMVRTGDIDPATGFGFEHIDPAIQRGQELTSKRG